MNAGERDELLFKLMLVVKRDLHQSVLGIPIQNVGFQGSEFHGLPAYITLSEVKKLNDDALNALAKSLRMGKAPAGAKADVYINGCGVSLKSLSAAPAALVNHTARPGFEFACTQSGVFIDKLDEIVEEYWRLREKGDISEDTRISDSVCPFDSNLEYMKPILEYFLFRGTGSKLSVAPAQYLIEFSDPFNDATYKKLTKADAVNAVWPRLIFSLRSKKGMPIDYNKLTYQGKNAESIAKWVRFTSGDYRGALHIRESK